MVTETSSSESLAVAERVRELMSRHGIGKRQQTAELCRILDLSFSQGHRKLRGNSPWTLSQIRRVAEVFGEPAAQLFGAQNARSGRQPRATAHDAVFSSRRHRYSPAPPGSARRSNPAAGRTSSR